MQTQKLCLVCNVLQPVEAFAKNKAKHDGLQYRCRACWAEYRAKNNAALTAQKREHYAKNKDRLLLEKKEQYPLVAAAKREYQKAYAKADPVAAKKRVQAFHAKNPEYYREFRKKYPAKLNAKEVRRKAAKLQRTPPWLTVDDYWMIEQAYEISALRTKITGFPWHVDHVIPLLGKNVSGLHVPLNLRVIPGLDNLSKGNKFKV
jgi:hypothetical protein